MIKEAIRAGLLAACCLLLAACPPLADFLYATWVGGYYELEYTTEQSSDYPWNLRLPRHYLQTKVYTSPASGVDMYGQFAASTNEPWNSKQNFSIEKLWGKYWFGRGEFYIGAKEEKHFIDSPLLSLVNIDKASDKRSGFEFSRGQFARLNVFDVYGFSGNFYVSRGEPRIKYGWYASYYDSTDTAYVTKISKRIFKDKVSSAALAAAYIAKTSNVYKYNPAYDSGGTFISYVYQTNYEAKSSVLSADFKYLSPVGSFFAEYAVNPSTGAEAGDNYAAAAEIRDVMAGPFRFQLKGYGYGKNFRDELSDRFSARKNDFTLKTDPEMGRTGYYTEVIYLNPAKMFNVAFKNNYYETAFDSVKDDQSSYGGYIVTFSTKSRVLWSSVEAYTEFVRGFKGKSGVESFQDKSGTFPAMFVELQGETPVVYGRIQARLKDVGSKKDAGERLSFALEARVNITPRLQAYTRGVTVQSNYKKKNWSSVFYQIRYNIIPDIETYLEYGEGWQTDNLAFDNDILDNDAINTVNIVKMIFKVNF